MNSISPDLMYEFHGKEIGPNYKTHVDQAVKLIKDQTGPDCDIQVNIAPEKKSSSLFSVAMTVTGFGDTIFVKKVGKNIIPTLKKVRKTLLNKVRRLNNKRIDRKRHRYAKELLAS